MTNEIDISCGEPAEEIVWKKRLLDEAGTSLTAADFIAGTASVRREALAERLGNVQLGEVLVDGEMVTHVRELIKGDVDTEAEFVYSAIKDGKANEVLRVYLESGIRSKVARTAKFGLPREMIIAGFRVENENYAMPLIKGAKAGDVMVLPAEEFGYDSDSVDFNEPVSADVERFMALQAKADSAGGEYSILPEIGLISGYTDYQKSKYMDAVGEMESLLQALPNEDRNLVEHSVMSY